MYFLRRIVRLSKNFHLSEMTKSQVASRNNILNEPSTNEIVALTALVTACLQPIRNEHGVVSISSGYRSKELAPLVKSKITSSHCFGEAADFECYSISNYKLADWIVNNLPEWDQLILEYHNIKIPNSGWLHLSYKRDGKNRKEVKRAILKSNKTVYLEGLK
ncbi:MAG TPA: peptidase M15 [Algoriphagus sp.]|nr:peptidase M15 [Algoriphagus sp.]